MENKLSILDKVKKDFDLENVQLSKDVERMLIGSEYRLGLLNSKGVITLLENNLYIGISDIVKNADYIRFVDNGEEVTLQAYCRLYDVIRKISDTLLLKLDVVSELFFKSETYREFKDTSNGMYKQEYNYKRIVNSFYDEINNDWYIQRRFIDIMKQSKLKENDLFDLYFISDEVLASLEEVYDKKEDATQIAYA